MTILALECSIQQNLSGKFTQILNKTFHNRNTELGRGVGYFRWFGIKTDLFFLFVGGGGGLGALVLEGWSQLYVMQHLQLHIEQLVTLFKYFIRPISFWPFRVRSLFFQNILPPLLSGLFWKTYIGTTNEISMNCFGPYQKVVSCYLIAAQNFVFSSHEMVRPICCFLFLTS